MQFVRSTHLPLSDPACRPLYPRFHRPARTQIRPPKRRGRRSLGGHRKKAVLDAKGELLSCTSLFRRPPIFFSPVQVWYLNPLLPPDRPCSQKKRTRAPRSVSPFFELGKASVLQIIRAGQIDKTKRRKGNGRFQLMMLRTRIREMRPR